MKLAIVGSRTFFLSWDATQRMYVVDKEKQLFFDEVIRKEFRHFPYNPDCKVEKDELQIISGGALGVDLYAEEFAKQWEIKTLIFQPDWKKYGKMAGFIRNDLIIQEADKVIAFWDGLSKGTEHSINLGRKKGIPVDVHIRK